MPKPERAYDPVASSRTVCHCGFDVPPPGCRPTELWVATHRAHHLRSVGPRGLKEWKDVADAAQIAIEELEHFADRLKQDIADRDDRIEDLEAELDAWLRRDDA